MPCKVKAMLNRTVGGLTICSVSTEWLLLLLHSIYPNPSDKVKKQRRMPDSHRGWLDHDTSFHPRTRPVNESFLELYSASIKVGYVEPFGCRIQKAKATWRWVGHVRFVSQPLMSPTCANCGCVFQVDGREIHSHNLHLLT